MQLHAAPFGERSRGSRLLDAEVVPRERAADARLGERVAAARALCDQRSLHAQRRAPLQRGVSAAQGQELCPWSSGEPGITLQKQ